MPILLDNGVQKTPPWNGQIVVTAYILGAIIMAIPFTIGLINDWSALTTAVGCNPALGGLYGAIGAAFIIFVIKQVKDRKFQEQMTHNPKQKYFETEGL